MKKTLIISLALVASSAVFGGTPSYMLPKANGVQLQSLLTVGDSIGGYKMVGIPDGLGARWDDNRNIELYMNHELSSTVGTVRAHGSAGSFVSKWTINPSNLAVTAGSDLITSVASVPGGSAPFGRFCSSDLPNLNAFYNPVSGLGTQNRIYMKGEEVGAEGRAFGTLVSGANTGLTSYLPSLGKFSWENAVAHDKTGDKTVVAGMDDSGNGQVYFYEGTKKSTGDDFDKAGLKGGRTLGLKINGVPTEQAGTGSSPLSFSFADLGDVTALSGADLETASTAADVTRFARPEDFSWDPTNKNVAYWATTGATGVGSKLWKMTFNDVDNLTAGGSIEVVLDSSDGVVSMDNLVVDNQGNILIQEDAGGNDRLAKIWHLNGASGALNLVAEADPNLFMPGSPNFLTRDEETSGIIDASEFLGKGWYFFDMQAHYPMGPELIEGGQLIAMYIPFAVPEPGSFAVLAIGAFAIMRRKKSN